MTKSAFEMPRLVGQFSVAGCSVLAGLVIGENVRRTGSSLVDNAETTQKVRYVV